MSLIPVVDLFAGPGGLGEGFSAYTRHNGQPVFDIVLSIEKQSDAHNTLELRSFFRKFPEEQKPGEYYEYLKGEISREDLFRLYPEQAALARNEAWHAELGGNSELNERIDSRIKELIKKNKNGCWILIGGPPCQAYSVVGRARNRGIKNYIPEDDPRNYLYKEYLRIIAEHRPALFVMENVKGMLSSKLNGKSVFEKIIDDLRCPSKSLESFFNKKHEGKNEYEIYPLVLSRKNSLFSLHKPKDFIVEPEKYGIPQARHRVILFGIRKNFTPHCPDSLQEKGEVTVRDVIAGLPMLRSGLSRENDTLAVWKKRLLGTLDRRWFEKGIKKRGFQDIQDTIMAALSEIEYRELDRGKEFIPCDIKVRPDLAWWYLDENLGGACNHASRAHMVKDLYRYLYAACFAEYFGRSPKIMEFPTDLIPNHKNAKSGHFKDRFRVQLADKPASTITSHIAKDGHYFIHYDPVQSRSLTVREAARLQTFPDNYFFEGNRTQQYIQVGNAVPPLLARQIAGVLHKLIARTFD